MHVIFNSIIVNGKKISDIEHCDVTKKVVLGFEISRPVKETQFSKTITVKKTNFFTWINNYQILMTTDTVITGTFIKL